MSSSTHYRELLLALLSSDSAKTVTEIANELSLSEQVVRGLLKSLITDGTVLKTGNSPEQYGLNPIAALGLTNSENEKDLAESSNQDTHNKKRLEDVSTLEERILDHISTHGPQTIDEIAIAFSISKAAVSRHLASLEQSGAVKKINSPKGPNRVYVEHETLHLPASAFDENGGSSASNDQNATWGLSEGPTMQGKRRKEENITDSNPQMSSEPERLISMDAENVDLVFHGQNVKPCFKVQVVAEAFISVVDSISSLQPNSISMLGIFAAWGRGKSYLFDIVKKVISKRPKEMNQYDVIEFNAWKYQSVPAIWASLFETVYHHKSRLFRFWFLIKRNAWPLLRDLLLFLSVPVAIWLITHFPGLSDWAKQHKSITYWSFGISFLAYVIKLISTEQRAIQEIISKYFKGISFAQHLGVQAEIEKNLAKYLKQWIPDCKTKTKKVILYVEDVDRCDQRKMLDLIESLRTVLEQPDIRKRLIVVLSIDAEKLWEAIKLKYKELYEGEKLYETIVNHFDKLFTASITLSELDANDEIEFIDALKLSPKDFFSWTAVKQALESLKRDSPDEPNIESVASTGRPKEVTTFVPSRHPSVAADDNLDVIRLIRSSVKSFEELHLTPRQLSCFYFRSLLAVNLIASSPEQQRIDSNLTDQILIRSYLHNRKELVKQTPYEDVLRMVIPYPFAE